jgi:tetratricopeptide (TPR) repeat protein
MKLNMNKSATIGVLVLSLGLWGCSSSHNSNPQAAAAQQLQAQRQMPKPEPLTADTRFAAGQLAESQGNTDVAIKQYKAALKTDSKHLPSMYRLAVVYSQLKKFDDAIGAWQQYVKATNSAAGAYSNLAFCYELAGRGSDAEATYQKGITRDPKDLACRTNYGLMLARHDRVTEAMAIWRPVLSEAEMHYNLASVYEMNGHKFEARTEYQKALQLDPKLTDAKSRLAQLQ